MKNISLKTLITCCIAAVWLVNGLYCKVLHFVPRHEQIVARILGPDHAGLATTAIGLLEMGMVVWICSGIRPRLCAFCQLLIVAVMNILEFWLVPDLLLFGRFNILVACIFLAVVYLHGFGLPKRQPSFPSEDPETELPCSTN